MNPKLKLGAAILIIAALLVTSRLVDVQDHLRSLLRWLEGLGAWGPLIFVLIYIVACVLFVPGWFLSLGAGVVFGVARGSVFVSIGATLGATAAFLAGRYLAREWVFRRIQGNPKFQAIDEAVGREGWKIVGLTRLSPVFPFNLLNYAFGVTRVSVWDYLLASWIGMLPGTVTYVYVGSLLGDLGNVGRGGRSRTPAEWVMYVVGLLATVAVSISITRLARKALASRINS